MIYDCFSFFNELDVLEIRLNTLDEVVDHFVLVEATYTHTGKDKPLYFRENAARFDRFKDKIIHVVVNEKPIAPLDEDVRGRAWGLENYQRNAIAQGLKDAKPDDVIIVSDVDEIPDPTALRKALHKPGITRLGLRMYYFFLNYRNLSQGGQWAGPQIATYATFSDPKKNVAYMGEFLRPYANNGPTASVLRMAKSDWIIKNAGWHFSYLGGVPAIQKKLASIAHTEFDKASINNPDFLRDCIASGTDIFGRGDAYYVEAIDSSYPEFIRNNKSRYSQLIFNLDGAAAINRKTSRLAVAVKLGLQSLILDNLPRSLTDRIVRIKKIFFPNRFV